MLTVGIQLMHYIATHAISVPRFKNKNVLMHLNKQTF